MNFKKFAIGQSFTASDDAFNIIEGLRHGGIAQRMRKRLTPFGSGWDALRNLAKGKESFEAMLSSTGFQKALASASTVKVIGEPSAMGVATLMKSSFRGREFQFVRKTGAIGEMEADSMRMLQHSIAPTVYSNSSKHIDMEMFEGVTAASLSKQGLITPDHIKKMREAVGEMKKVGISHSDFHGGNMIFTPEGRIGAIDFGASGPVGTIAWHDKARGTVYGGFRKGADGSMIEESITSRSFDYDYGRIFNIENRMLAKQKVVRKGSTSIFGSSESSLFDSDPDLFSRSDPDLFSKPQASAATRLKKRAQSDLQRAHQTAVTKAAKMGGKRSRS